MYKFLIISLVLCFALATYARGASKSFVEPQWGAKINEFTNMTFVTEYKNGVNVYNRKDDVLRIGDVPVNSISYLFNNKIFFSLKINCNSEHFGNAKKAITELFVKDKKSYGTVIAASGNNIYVVATNVKMKANTSQNIVPAAQNAITATPITKKQVAKDGEKAISTASTKTDSNTRSYQLEVVLDGVNTTLSKGTKLKRIAGSEIIFKRLLLDGVDTRTKINFKGWVSKGIYINNGDDRDYKIVVSPDSMIKRYSTSGTSNTYPVTVKIDSKDVPIIYIEIEDYK